VSVEKAIAQAKEAAAGDRGRLSIGTIAPITQAFLPDALARFRELFPLVEVSVSYMDNRTQTDALLNGTIMLGIGYPSLSMEESDLLSIELLLRSPICIACPKNRWPAKRNRPALSDFRDDNFLAFSEFAGDYMDMVRKICRRGAGFEPTLLPVADSFESLIGMVAAGRGVFLCPEAIRDRAVGVNFQVLGGSKGEFELFLVRRKEPEPAATVNNFVKILFEAVQRLQTRKS
jgi:DNA-binding transcriptional LysR family regulator